MSRKKLPRGIQREKMGVRARIRRMEVDSNAAERARVRKKLAENIKRYAFAGNVSALERSLKDIEVMRERGFFPGREKSIEERMRKAVVRELNRALLVESKSESRVLDFSKELERFVKKGIVSRARARKIAFSLGESLVARALPRGKPVSASIRVLDERMRAVLSLFTGFGVPKSKLLGLRKKAGGLAVKAIREEIAQRRKRVDLGVFEAIDEAMEKRLVSVEKGDALREEAIRSILERVSRDEMSSIGVGRAVLQIEHIHSRPAREKLRALARKHHF